MKFLHLLRAASITLAIVASCVSTAQATVILAPSISYSAYSWSSGNYTANYAGDNVTYGAMRMYEKFLLPTFVAGTTVTSAFINFSITSRLSATNPLGLFSVSNDTWTTTSGWGGKPAMGALITSFNPASSAATYSFDVTAFINSQYLADGVASLAVGGMTEGIGKNSFTYFNPAGTTLSYTVTSATTVPEPGSLALLGLGLAGIAVLRGRKQ